MLTAACNSLPVAEVDRIIPGAQDFMWVIAYQIFEFEQSQPISLICWSSSNIGSLQK
jgi:hypothetical protein